MFSNIGGKIKTLAKIICWIGIILSVVTGVIMMIHRTDIVITTSSGAEAIVSPLIAGLTIIIVGCLTSWIGAFFAYGFGQLIENSEEIKKNTSK